MRVSREAWIGLAAGAVAGGLVAWLVWRYADTQLHAQLEAGGGLLQSRLTAGRSDLTARARAARQEAEDAAKAAFAREIQPAIRAEVSRALRAEGITPERIQLAIDAARRTGMI